MAKDLIYYFDKLTKKRFELGEIQTDFNMSLTIDGTKDSTKVEVFSFNGNEIEPWTIIWHAKTNTWWVVAHDRVNRYTNEIGFAYIHEIELVGAIELLNARDLTDCGFNDNTYSVGQFIERLFTLSNFEYSFFFDSSINQNFLSKTVDYIKTFENYTLLSSLREFLDGYNQVAKLTFDTSTVNNETYIYYARLHIIPKTGRLENTHNIDDFDDVREIKSIDHNSFGTCVISNAENVISMHHKTYPATGSVRLSSKQYLIVDGAKLNDAVIRLPSKVYKGNWIKIVYPCSVSLFIQDIATNSFTFRYKRSNVSFQKMISYFKQQIIRATGTQAAANEFESRASNDYIEKALYLASSVTLFDGNNINAFTGEITKGNEVPYLATFRVNNDTNIPFIFTDKNTKDSLKDPKQAIAWERGSNIISGFDMFDSSNYIVAVDRHTDYQGHYMLLNYQYGGLTYTLRIGTQILKDVGTFQKPFATQLSELSFIIDYIPMADMKIKIDNQRDKKDIQLYNQNGRLTDNVALSKLLNSYSKEISSDNIVRYKQYYNFDEVPKVGDIVINGNDYYVISNLSLDFKQNETPYSTTFGYFIECEITMCKYVTTKTLLINPNTNIRDYGIPQNFVVKRKQVYRDYYELDYETFSDANQETPYYPLEKIWDFGTNARDTSDLIGVIKLTYDELIEDSNNWYYQLDTTRYDLDKTFYMILDFNDNNIIGYCSQNVFSGFDVSRILDGLTDNLNTPISYTDSKGKVKDISIMFCNITQITNIYDEYQLDNNGQTFEGNLYNYSVFVPQDIYASAENSHEIAIIEENYNKDALEVPVFEYACQIGDSEKVLIGDNILRQYDNCIYFYSFVVGTNLTPNNVAPTQSVESVTSPVGWRILNACRFDLTTIGNIELLLCYAQSYARYNASDGTWSYGLANILKSNTDLAVFRHALNLTTGKEEHVDLMFVAKRIPSDHILNNRLALEINHYKLK